LIKAEKKKYARAQLAGLSRENGIHRKRELSRELGVSVRTLDRWTKDIRPNGRKKRSDSGVPKSVTSDILDALISYRIKNRSSAINAIAWAVANKKLALGQISPRRLNSIMRDRGLDPKALALEPDSKNAPAGSRRPCRKMVASRPNQLWELDATVLEQFAIEHDDSVNPMGFEERYSKKPDKRNRPVVFVGMDYYSRCVFMRVYPNESASSAMDFLYEMISPKSDDKNPFFGIPEKVYHDNGSGFKDERYRRACGDIGVEIVPRLPWTPRATGMVERFMRTLNKWMDAVGVKKFKGFEDMNRTLRKLAIVYNNRQHSTTGVRPFDAWTTISPENLVAPPRYELFWKFKYRETTRRISQYMTISLMGEEYELPTDPFNRYRLANEPVTVRYLPGYSEVEVMHDGSAYRVREGVRTHEIGEFRQHADTPDVKAFKKAKRSEMAQMLESAKESPFDAAFDAAPDREQPAAGSRQSLDVPETLLDRSQAKIMLHDQRFVWRDLDAFQVAIFDEAFMNSEDGKITESDFSDLVNRLSEPAEPDSASDVG